MLIPIQNEFGFIRQRITTGKKDSSKALILELTVVSKIIDNLFSSEKSFDNWLIKAHSLIEHNFFSFLSDELLKEFQSE